MGHLSCRHLTKLDTAVATGKLEGPKVWDPLLKILWERGMAHEQSYVKHLEQAGFEVARIDGAGIETKQVDDTIEGMRAGVEIIVQGCDASSSEISLFEMISCVILPAKSRFSRF